MITNNPYLLQHQSAIFRESTNTTDHKTKTPLQALIALTVIFNNEMLKICNAGKYEKTHSLSNIMKQKC